MSNEINDSHAKWMIERYPFLTIKDNSVHPWLKIDSTEYHWLSDIPAGWVNSFGIEMCDELLKVLDKYVDDFIIVQTKEKYGSFVVYYYWSDIYHTNEELEEISRIDKEVRYILDKYKHLSYHTCVICGRVATKYSSPWILPFCDNCFENLDKHFG